jgi:hypothetical protein
MDARTNKNRLIETMRIERARWDMLLVQVDSDRMTVPGVAGKLSVKDIIADVVRQERWVASQLQQDAAGEPAPLEKPEELSAGRSVRELMEESRRAFEQIVRILMRLPAEEIFSPQSYEWTGGNAVGAVIPTYTVEHYRRYHDSIRRWMTKRRRRRSQARTA